MSISSNCNDSLLLSSFCLLTSAFHLLLYAAGVWTKDGRGSWIRKRLNSSHRTRDHPLLLDYNRAWLIEFDSPAYVPVIETVKGMKPMIKENVVSMVKGAFSLLDLRFRYSMCN